MSSVRLVSPPCALALLSCSRPSDPPPGPAAATPSAGLSGSSAGDARTRRSPGRSPPSLPDRETAQKLAQFVDLEDRGGADALVTKYCDDPFTDAAFGLMVKKITSAPIETAFGFHIIAERSRPWRTTSNAS